MSQFQSTGSWWWPFSYMFPWPLLYMYEGGGQRSLVSNILRTLILWGQNPPLYHHLTSVIPLEATAVERYPGGYSFHTWGLWEHKTSPTVFQCLQYLAKSEILRIPVCFLDTVFLLFRYRLLQMQNMGCGRHCFARYRTYGESMIILQRKHVSRQHMKFGSPNNQRVEETKLVKKQCDSRKETSL